MTTTEFDVLIVGGGHGGAQAAIALRQRKFAGTIAVVGEEPDLPYERPPLSKDYLSGDKAFDRILIYLKQGRVIALDCVNAVKDYVQGKRLVLDGLKVDLGDLSDPAMALKAL